MTFNEIVESTFTCRSYRTDPVARDVLARVLDAARFAPTGGNRQPVRFVAVRDAASRRRLKELYLPIWKQYFDSIRRRAPGLMPTALLERADRFAEHLDDIPVMVVVCARLADVYPTDARLGRLSIVGGASVYPAVQNLLLKAREEGLGTALTTLLCLVEPQVKELLAIPEDFATAAMVTIGWPAEPFPPRLSRRPLSKLAYGDRFGEPL